MIALVRTSGDAGGPAERACRSSSSTCRCPASTVRPIVDLTGDAHFNEVFFDDVLLADDALIGEEGDGWAQVNAELAFERSGPERLYSSVVLLEHWIACLRGTGHAARDWRRSAGWPPSSRRCATCRLP